MGKKLFVLGAMDPEMATISELARAAGHEVVGALSVDGRPVHGGNAYQASRARTLAAVALSENLILVECAFADGDVPPDVVRVDHHRPGDPGFGRPAAEFWQASSLGQVFNLLGTTWATKGPVVEIKTPAEFGDCTWCGPRWGVAVDRRGEILDACNCDGGWATWSGSYMEKFSLVAAADHCLAAAYRGECPGVEPGKLRNWRTASRAVFQKISESSLSAAVAAAEAKLASAPRVVVGGEELRDMRADHTPELPEAATYLGVGYVARVQDRDQRWKTVVSAGEVAVRAFLAGAIPGLTGRYGDPARGFAGGYEA